MEEPIQKDLTDYLDALRRRKTPALVIGGLLLVASVLVAFLLPPAYRSTATILIEEQEIPQDLVRSTVTTYALQRIQTISQRVMTRSNLMQIIDKYGLYADERRTETSEEVIDGMRDDIKLDTISADVIDPQSGRPTQATIAFTLAYQGEDPNVTQRVANELVSLYLNENLKNRAEKATEASQFLTEEAQKLSKHIAEVEARLAAFKEQNKDSLPELLQLNLQLMTRTENDLRDTNNEIRAAEERRFYLQGQLDQINPMYSMGEARAADPEFRLKSLRTEYIADTTKYSPKHPDVIQLKNEIEALERELGTTSDASQQARELSRARADLAAAREKYSESHPDVVALKAKVEALEKSLPTTPERRVAAANPDNPAYITLKAQYESLLTDIESLKNKRKQLQNKLNDYEKHIASTPQAEREYSALVRDQSNTDAKYREIKAKQMEAEVAQQLEKESKAERFTLIDPPQLPEKPVSPNRPAIVFLGLMLSLGGGIGYTAASESLDKSVRGVHGIMRLVGVAPLASIPYRETDQERATRRRRQRWIALGVLVTLGVTVALIHIFVVPLDVAWFKLLRKLGIDVVG